MVKFLTTTSFRLYLVSFFTATLGLACQVLIARSYGASNIMDAYLISIAIPVFLASLIASACSFGLIPKLTAYQYSPSEFACFSQATFIFGLIVSIFFLLMLFLAPIQVSYFSELLNIDRKTLLALFRIGWCIGACQIFISIGSAILNAKGLYIVSTSLAWFPYLGIILALMVFDQEQNILKLSFGLLFGTLSGVLVSLIFLASTLLSNLSHLLAALPKYFAEIATTSAKSVALASIFTSYLLVDSYWAPVMGDGVMSILGYAQRLLGSIGALAITAVYVMTGREAQSELSLNGIAAFRESCIQFTKTAFLLSSILAFILLLFIESLVDLLFASKTFNEQDLNILASTVRIMLPGMICMLVSTILTKLILCLDNSGFKVVLIGMLWPGLYFLGIYWLFDFGLVGIAISYSISWLILVIVLLVNLFTQTKSS